MSDALGKLNAGLYRRLYEVNHIIAKVSTSFAKCMHTDAGSQQPERDAIKQAIRPQSCQAAVNTGCWDTRWQSFGALSMRRGPSRRSSTTPLGPAFLGADLSRKLPASLLDRTDDTTFDSSLLNPSLEIERT